MEDFLQQIEIALDYNLYYLALQSTLTLPDICGALESQNGESTKSKYLTWYNKYAKSSLHIPAEDCYYFRCANVHQGKTTHPKSEFSRILFVEPQISTLRVNNCVFDNALCIDVNIFCKSMISSVRNWLKLMQNNSNFQNNYKNFIRRYPEGLAPYIGGVPVIS